MGAGGISDHKNDGDRKSTSAGERNENNKVSDEATTTDVSELTQESQESAGHENDSCHANYEMEDEMLEESI